MRRTFFKTCTIYDGRSMDLHYLLSILMIEYRFWIYDSGKVYHLLHRNAVYTGFLDSLIVNCWMYEFYKICFFVFMYLENHHWFYTQKNTVFTLLLGFSVGYITFSKCVLSNENTVFTCSFRDSFTLSCFLNLIWLSVLMSLAKDVFYMPEMLITISLKIFFII